MSSSTTTTATTSNGAGGSTAGTSASAVSASKENMNVKEGAGQTEWGANFWVTLADPSSGAEFYACPATGECAWDPPEGNFVLPRSADGEWWEIEDTSGSGLPYYYHTRTGDTVWTRPEGFVIPLAIIQTTTLGKRLSTAYLSPRASIVAPSPSPAPAVDTKPEASLERLTPPATPTMPQAPSSTQSQSHSQHRTQASAMRSSGSSRRREGASSPSRVAFADVPFSHAHASGPPISVSPPTPSMRPQRPTANRPPVSGHPTPIVTPPSSYTNGAAPPPPSSFTVNGRPALPRSSSTPATTGLNGNAQRMRSKSSTQLRANSEDAYSLPLPHPQSLQAAAELITGRRSVSGPRPQANGFYAVQKASASSASLAIKRQGGGGGGGGGAGSWANRPRGQSLKGMIGAPVVDHEAARRMAPRREGAPAVFVGVSKEKEGGKERERDGQEREGDRIGLLLFSVATNCTPAHPHARVARFQLHRAVHPRSWLAFTFRRVHVPSCFVASRARSLPLPRFLV